MNNLTISQEYFLCVLTEKGRLASVFSDAPNYLFAGSMLDLFISKALAFDEKKKVVAADELRPEYAHLSPLYQFVKESKPRKIGDIFASFNMTFTDKRLNELIGNIGVSLADKQCVEITYGGIGGKKPYYVPVSGAVNNVVQQIRAELLEDGAVSENMIALVSLLNESGDIKKYFSAYEKDRLNAHLKEIKTSDSNKLLKEIFEVIDEINTVIILLMTTASQ
jgi:hypothetical protein